MTGNIDRHHHCPGCGSVCNGSNDDWRAGGDNGHFHPSQLGQEARHHHDPLTKGTGDRKPLLDASASKVSSKGCLKQQGPENGPVDSLLFSIFVTLAVVFLMLLIWALIQYAKEMHGDQDAWKPLG